MTGAFDPKGPVFISYRRSDGQHRAELLDTYLRAAGLVPWRDLVDLPPGETAQRVSDAFDGGISSAILLVTPEIEDSQFVPEHELPPLRAMDADEGNTFRLHVVNTIPGEEFGDIDVDAPDKLLKVSDDPKLRNLKHFAFLPARSELRQLVRDLLSARLRARHQTLADNEINIQTQSRPLPDSYSRFSGPTVVGAEHDLMMRLRLDRFTGVPEELGYRCLQQTLPLMVDAIYASGVRKVTQTGGGHFSIGWALGAALPSTRTGFDTFTSVDLSNNVWSERLTQDRTFCARTRQIEVSSEAAPGPGRVAVLLQYANLARQSAFTSMVESLPNCRAAVVINVEPLTPPAPGGRVPPIPSDDGQALAEDITACLRQLANDHDSELHIASSLPTSLTALCGRRMNTVNCVLYEWGRDWTTGAKRYYPVIRVQSGEPGGPITEVFPQRRWSWDRTPVTEVVNLTSRAVSLYRNGSVVHEWAAADASVEPVGGELAKEMDEVFHEDVAIPVFEVIPTPVKGQPAAVPGRAYIVSRAVAEASDRNDFYFPHEGVSEDGTRVGVEALGRFPASDDNTVTLMRLVKHPCPLCGGEAPTEDLSLNHDETNGIRMTTLANYTPHTALTYRPEGGEAVVLPQLGSARCAEEYLPAGKFHDGDLPLTLMRYGEVTGLPDPQPGTVFVVSQLVVNALPERTDLAFPAGLVRDGEGTIIGFRYLARPVPVD